MKLLTIFFRVKEVFSILDAPQKRSLYALQVLLILSSLLEAIGITSIAPFMMVVNNPEIITTNQWLATLYEISNLQTVHQFLILLGTLAFALMSVGTLLSMFTFWNLSFISWNIGKEVADKLYKLYLNQSWLFHTNENSARFIKQITFEAMRFSGSVLQPLLFISSRLLITFFLILVLIWIHPILIIGTTILISSFYILIFKVIKKRLAKYGQLSSESFNRRSHLMQESFGGIKDILLLHKQASFIRSFQSAGEDFAKSQAMTAVLSGMPRMLVELVIFSLIVLSVIFLTLVSGELNENLIGILGIFAVAGIKLLPAVNQIYSSLSELKANLAAFHAIKKDLNRCHISISAENIKLPELSLENEIKLQNVDVFYSSKPEAALKKVNLTLPKNKTIGLVGPSGSGKSTAIDVLLGLIPPSGGQLLIDDKPIEGSKLTRAWQSIISYVPQTIFLADTSIAANIAFHLDENQIDYERINQVTAMASLTPFIETLPNNIHTRVGERGIQLSGGQRQRIGIARALYQKADVIFMDEATSSLDNLTEQSIMQSIENLAGTKTLVIVAHRLTTIRKCDLIYVFKNGKIVGYGNYDELSKNSQLFRSMAKYTN